MADTKLTALSGFTPILTDVIYAVDDPGGTPASGKVTFQNALTLFQANTDADDIDDTSTTNKFATAAQLGKVDFLTVTGAVDLDNLFDGDAANLTGTVSVNRFNSGTGASGSTYLAGDGTWKTPAGSGDVSKVGTPANNQVGIWTGDGTIEGDSNFVWTGTELDLTGDAVFTGTFVVIGNIGTTGTVDGRDVAADGSVIDSLATVATSGDAADLTGTLAVERLGGDSSGGDPTKFLTETGSFLSPTGAWTSGSGAPGTAPTAIGDGYVDTAGPFIYLGGATSSASDYKRLVTSDDIQLPANVTTATVATGDYLTFGDSTASDAVRATTVANFISDLSILTDTSTSTLTNKTLTNPKTSYTPNPLGTITTGTVTPSVANGNLETYTNGGAHTLAPPSAAGSWIITITNNGSAGAITTSGYTAVKGDSFTTTNTHKFICTAISDGTNSVLTVQALQ